MGIHMSQTADDVGENGVRAHGVNEWQREEMKDGEEHHAITQPNKQGTTERKNTYIDDDAAHGDVSASHGRIGYECQ